MDFYDVISARRSVRQFTAEPVSAEARARIAQCVAAAPSACNRQPYRFLWIENPELIRQLHSVTVQPSILDAPVVVAGLVNRDAAWRLNENDARSIGEIDLAIAAEHFALAVTAEKLGSCWVAAFDTVRAAEILQVQAPWYVDVLFPVGHPAGDLRPFARVSADEMMKVL